MQCCCSKGIANSSSEWLSGFNKERHLFILCVKYPHFMHITYNDYFLYCIFGTFCVWKEKPLWTDTVLHLALLDRKGKISYAKKNCPGTQCMLFTFKLHQVFCKCRSICATRKSESQTLQIFHTELFVILHLAST